MSTQYAFRAQKSLALVSGSPDYAPISEFTAPEGTIKQYAYSPDGTLYACASTSSVQIHNATTGAMQQTIGITTAVELAFSPKGSLLSTWERPVKLEDGAMHKNLRVWQASTGQEVVSFSQKAQEGWNLQYSEDEAYALRMVSGEVHVFRTAAFADGIVAKLRLEGATSFSLSPGRNPAVALFIAEKKGQPASLKIYQLASIVNGGAASPISQKTFFKADKITMKWNKLGTSLIFVTQTDVDKTNKSYYGETNMYLMATTGNFDCRVTLDKEGPIHDFAWSPSSKEFGVVYGFMPARTTLFDHRVNVIHDFGPLPRNYISFNPQGRLVLLAGFGNLNGTVDVWDRKTLQKVASFDAANTSYCEWSPDGRFIMCATCSPRLRVDNGIKIFHFSGALLHANSIEELYQASWRPAPAESFPFRSSLSPAPSPAIGLPSSPAAKATPKAAGAYRPPHARGQATPDIFKREDEGGAPYVRPNGTASPGGSLAAGQPKRRTIPGAAAAPAPSKESQPRRKKKQAEGTIGDVPAPAPKVEAVTDALGSTSLSAEDKKKRALLKKLGAIEQLKERRDRGERLEKTQETKIAAEAEVRGELKALGHVF